MPCEHYREALSEAAAMGAGLPGELSAHRQACRSCEALWNQERQLFAAIDAGVQRAVNSEIPPSFLPRVRAAADEIVVSRRWSWMPAAAVMLAAAAIVAMILVGGRTVKKDEANRETLLAQKHSSPAETPVKSAPLPENAKSESARLTRTGTETRKSRAATAAGERTQVRVLVPQGEKQSVDKILAALQRSKAERSVLSADKGEATGPERTLAPLEIPPIEVKPLARVSEEATSENEKTKL